MKSQGFTLIELMVVIAIISILATVGMVVFSGAQKAARNGKRVTDVKALYSAIQNYYFQTGNFPAINPASQDVGGWEVSYKNGFLSTLVPNFIPEPILDPINQLETGFDFFGPKAGSYFYAYYHYPDPAYYGCTFTGSFAVIAIRQLEGGRTNQTPAAKCGVIPPGGCPLGGIPNTCRDWSTEFDYSLIIPQ